MRFDSEKPLRQLIEKGIVATMRHNRKIRIGPFHQSLYIPGIIVNITSKGKRIGKAVVVEVYENTRENREKLVEISGFDTVEEWEKEARKLFKGKLPNTIVVLRLIELRAAGAG